MVDSLSFLYFVAIFHHLFLGFVINTFLYFVFFFSSSSSANSALMMKHVIYLPLCLLITVQYVSLLFLSTPCIIIMFNNQKFSNLFFFLLPPPGSYYAIVHLSLHMSLSGEGCFVVVFFLHKQKKISNREYLGRNLLTMMMNMSSLFEHLC